MSDIALPNSGVPQLPRAERLLSDELLAKLTARGNGRAFATLYERHHQALYRYCRSILRNDHDAQDALQSAMTRAYAALCARERDLAVRPWLFRIAHNEAISITRKRGPRETVEQDLEQPGGVEQTLELRQRLSRLVSDMQELPERQRAALVMRELSGLSIAEIALALEISQGAAKQALFEARSSLHDLAEGREMECERVREAISLKDGRVLRGRRIGAHLRDCEECRAFRTAIDVRSADLRALAPPLPAVTASAMLGRVLAHGGGHASGNAVSGATLGGHAAGSLLAKGVVGVAVMAAAAGTVKLTVERHASATGRSGGHNVSTHAGGAAGISPAAQAHGATSGGRGNAAGRNNGAGTGSSRGSGATTPAVSGPAAREGLDRNRNGQAHHEGNAGGAARGHGRAHHENARHPAGHHARGRPPTPPGSQHQPSHRTHRVEGQGSQSQGTHSRSGTGGAGDHGATATGESHASQRDASGGEGAAHAGEAVQVAPQPSR